MPTRVQSALRLRLRRDVFAPTRTLGAFGFNVKLNTAQCLDLDTCQVVERHGNALIYGPTGTGKPFVACALVPTPASPHALGGRRGAVRGG